MCSAHCSSLLPSAAADSSWCPAVLQAKGSRGCPGALSTGLCLTQCRSTGWGQAKNVLYVTQQGRAGCPIISFELYHLGGSFGECFQATQIFTLPLSILLSWKGNTEPLEVVLDCNSTVLLFLCSVALRVVELFH